MLGPLEISADSGSVLAVRGARLRALLILVALQPGRVITASRLAGPLWGDDQPAVGR
jgi:DNA-binding SARP family transcriptional activator